MNFCRNILILFSFVVCFSEFAKLREIMSSMEEKNIHGVNFSLENYFKFSFSITLCLSITTVVLSFFAKTQLKITNIVVQFLSVSFLFVEFVSPFFSQTKVISGFSSDILNTIEAKSSLRCCRFSSMPQTKVGACHFEATCDERLIEVYQKISSKYSISTAISTVFEVGCLFTTLAIYLDLFPADVEYEKVTTKTVLDEMEDL